MAGSVNAPRLLMLAGALAVVIATPCQPQAGGMDKEQKQQQQQQAIGERVYRRLQQAHAALGDRRYAQAKAKLENLEALSLNDYERALTDQTYGFLYAGQGNYTLAIEYFERCLARNALPVAARQGTLFSLAGLYSAQGQWEETVAAMMRWLPYEPDPSPDALIMLAAANAELSRYREALPWAVAANEKSQTPKESGYQLLVAIQLQLRDFAAAAQTLRRMVAYWPDKLTYWEMLAGAYQKLGNDIEATSALRLAYRRGLLDSEPKLRNLARMMLYIEDPYQAAVLLDREMAAGRVERTQDNLRLLLGAWLAAREVEKGIAVIDQLAAMSGDGQYYLHKAQLLAGRAEWAEAIPAAEQAIARGGFDQPGAAWLLKGMSEAELGRFRQAIDSLTEAGKAQDREIRAQAEGWLQFVQEQQRVRVEMAATP